MLERWVGSEKSSTIFSQGTRHAMPNDNFSDCSYNRLNHGHLTMRGRRAKKRYLRPIDKKGRHLLLGRQINGDLTHRQKEYREEEWNFMVVLNLLINPILCLSWDVQNVENPEVSTHNTLQSSDAAELVMVWRQAEPRSLGWFQSSIVSQQTYT